MNCGRKEAGYDGFPERMLGMNARITEWQAAVLREQLRRLPEQHQRRAAGIERFEKQIAAVPGLRPLARDERVTERTAYQFILRYDSACFAGVPRDEVLLALGAEGVPCYGRFYVPIPEDPLFAMDPKTNPVARVGADYSGGAFPVTSRAAYQESIWLPHFLFLGGDEDVDELVAAFAKVQAGAAALRKSARGEESAMTPFRVGLIGSGGISRTYMAAFPQVPEGEVVAVWSRQRENAERFAREFAIGFATDRVEDLLPQVDVVCVNSPNACHAPHAIAAASAGKHVIVEKPLAVSLEEGRAIIDACAAAGVGLAYAEELPFVPKFERAREILESGALGEVLYLTQREAHGGPYSPWFFTRDEAGGGVLMDMACHAIELVRWVLGKPSVAKVTAHVANAAASRQDRARGSLGDPPRVRRRNHRHL